ncbi:hypothetical protein [Pedobacter sp.]
MESARPVFTIIERWQLIIWGICSAVLAGFAILLIDSHSANFFISILSIFICYYLSRYFCRASTAFEYLDDNTITISRYCKTLNINDSFSINIDEIRGYEINQVTRGNRALFLYFIDFNFLKLSLINIDDELVIENFLTQKLTRISEKSNPFFKKFWAAYWFALKRCMMFLALSIPVSCLLIWQHKILYLSPLIAGVIVSLLSVALWIFTVNKPTKHNYFRFAAFYWLSNFMIYLSPLLLFPIYFLVKQRAEKPLNLQNPFEILARPPAALYELKNVNYNPNEVTISKYFWGSRSGKSLKQSVYHYFATPITEKQPIITNGLYNIWLSIHFTQSVYKIDDGDVKEAQALNYQANLKQRFLRLFTKKPTFYKALFNDKKAYQTIYKSQFASKYNHIVLEPHWESIDEYRQDLMNRIFMFLGGILFANALGCLIIAYNR